MKTIILFIVLFTTGCINVGQRVWDKVEEMPAVRNKILSIENTCRRDTNEGKLNIRFSTSKEEHNFCTCLILGFTGTTDFMPIDQRKVIAVEREFERSPANYVITMSENLQTKYFDLVTTIKNSNGHPSWRESYEKMYRNNVNYCTKLANYGLAYE